MNISQIKERGLEIEQHGKLPKDVLEIIYEHQLFKLFVATELGGKNLDLLEGIKVFQQMSSLDGNFGWLVTIGTGGNIFIPTLDQEICEKIFSSGDAVIAGSGYPTGIAVKIDGGYRVTGQWKFCSGSDYATTFTMNCFIERDGIKTEDIISCAVSREFVEVLYDWRAMGLKATASHTIRIKDVWVPKEATFRIGLNKNSYGGWVHSFPFGAFAEASFLSVCLGITDNFLEEASILMKQKNNEVQLSLINEQLKRYKQIEEQFYKKLTAYWLQHKKGQQLTDGELHQFSQISKEGAAACVDIANSIIRSLGIDAILETSTINRIWRNLCTAAQHGFLTP
ncbi:acyl-CoA dehydrogenase [Lysinibacillus fusiformis]|nr:acyl-CoA dehydrogenase [Lysinibacillus fusiformis]